MADLFDTKGNQYDDNGNMMVNTVSAIEKGILTQTVGNTTGAISSIYDEDTSTYYRICNNQAGTFFLKWNFIQKSKFKNIYLFGEEAEGTITIDGSDDNSSWTTLATQTSTTAAEVNMLVSDVSYKYIRVQTTSASASQACIIKNIKGVL